MVKKSVIRNENILELSREHHFSLLFCWKIRKGIESGIEVERIRNYVQHFWNHFLQAHFKEEEEIFFTSIKSKNVDKALTEHREIESQIISLNFISILMVSNHLIRIADLVDNHVRFEESTLFPQVDKLIRREKLNLATNKVKKLDNWPFKDAFTDEFWSVK